tara:strand:+ start:984 stop:1457 length:474 start_codon:yes stop_codon:yes gene_type:complete
MLSEIYTFFTFETIYLWLNFGVLPLWIVLIFFPNSKINQILISSIFLPLIFSLIYIYIVYQSFIFGENFFELFNLYLSLDELKNLFSNDKFLLLFWIHFLAINLFLGSWVSRDAFKHNVPKFFSSFFLIFIYFTGPLGFVFYWFIRIFFAKKINLHD